MKLRLKYKLIASYIWIAVIVVGSLLVTSRYLITREFNQYVETNMENNMMLLAAQVNLDLNQQDTSLRQMDWESYGQKALDQGFLVTIQDADKKVFWCMQCVHSEICDTMLHTMEMRMRLVSLSAHGSYMEKSFDLIQKNQLVGTLVLGHYGPFHYSESEVNFLLILQRVFLIGAIFFILLSVFIGYIMASRIAKPIDQAIQQTKRIAQGSYEAFQVLPSTTIELEELMGAVNQLALTLDQQLTFRRKLAQDYAHEFRTPLAVLRSSIEGMIDGIWEVNEERLASLQEEILRLTRMVEDIDQLVDVENRSLILHKTTFPMISLLTTILHNFEGELKNKQITVAMTGKEVLFYGDQDKISQVIVNLISNAIKYNRTQGSIAISLQASSRQIELAIQDSGIGIAKQDLPYIFEHLFRADRSRSHETQGNGIGLAIVKSIVQAHQGTVEVKSELHEGTTFIVRLPNEAKNRSA